MTVSPISSQQTSSGTSSSSAISTNDFLHLLLSEMQNQDPTNPMDSTQYVAQLATFSEVGQATETNSKLDQLLQSSALSQAGSVIGRTVTSADGTISGTVSQVKVLSDSVTAVLSDGQEVPITEGVTIQ